MDRLRSGNDFEKPEKNPANKSLREWLAVSGILGLVFALCAIFHVWMYIQQVQNGYRLAKLYEEQEQLLAVQRKLRLEWSRFQDPFQLEELGSKQFGLAPPRQDRKLSLR